MNLRPIAILVLLLLFVKVMSTKPEFFSSAYEIMEDIRGGQGRVHPLSDYFQEPDPKIGPVGDFDGYLGRPGGGVMYMLKA
jgi:hypothetical protein